MIIEQEISVKLICLNYQYVTKYQYISDSVFIEEIVDEVRSDASKPFLHRFFNSV